MCKSSGSVYGLGVIGALFYNIQYADGLGQILWGILKSFLWPGFVVYHLLSWLQI